jgi:HK97 family phage prohead protease
MTAPRDDLIRSLGTFEVRASDDGEGRTLVGYAAKFNEDTTINSWEGQFVERIAPGAFKRSLGLYDRGQHRIQVLFNHGMDPSIGDKPLGRASVIREDEVGLYVEVPLSDTDYNRYQIIPLIRDGAIDGMSFRFSVNKEDWDEPKRGEDRLPIRTLREVKLMEFGPVTFPAYEATTAGVRSSKSFDKWLTLPEEQRARVLQIFGTSDEAVTATRSDEPADPPASTDQEPVAAGHHSARTAYIQWKARQLS